jgi:undecaprenyl-phosphate 4-deoxy-4-formamido-L-arabinose transferase
VEKEPGGENVRTRLDSTSVVIPVYNSEATLPELLARLHPVLVRQGGPFEIILVNDGSRDRSWDAIIRLTEIWPQVQGIDLPRNYGQHNALLCGIRASQHSFVVTMDDDLQHPPEEIPRLLHKLAEGCDVVYGPPCQEQHGWWRDGASILTKLVLRHFMGASTSRQVSAFRVFRTQLRDAFANYRSPFVSIDVLLTWGTTRFAAVPVRHEPRRVGRSNYNLRKLLVHAVNMTTGFSTLPLRIATLVGLATMIFGVAVLTFVIGRYLLRGSTIAGFPFLASITVIFSGAQLLGLGIMGEYLARMYLRLLDRPAFTIRQQVLPATYHRVQPRLAQAAPSAEVSSAA